LHYLLQPTILVSSRHMLVLVVYGMVVVGIE
jgi:hypothetical protein